MACRNICQRIGSKLTRQTTQKNEDGKAIATTSVYTNGSNRYCRRCEMYYYNNTELHHCPCCGLKLRSKTRASNKMKKRRRDARIELERQRLDSMSYILTQSNSVVSPSPAGLTLQIEQHPSISSVTLSPTLTDLGNNL